MNYFNQQTERLVFRKLCKENIPIWTSFFENNDAIGYLGVDVSKSSIVLATEWIEMQLWRYENQGFGHLAAISKEANEFLGLGGILPREIEGIQEHEIAYSFLAAHRGKGYATELAKCMLQYAQAYLDAPRFISIIHVENQNSERVAEKNGMTPGAMKEFNGMPVRFWEVENRASVLKKINLRSFDNQSK